jgi:ATP-dependent helicase HrpB
LPVFAALGEIVKGIRSGSVVVVSPPGSGKTTLVPTAVLDDLVSPSKVYLLQPRRLAARSVARRIALLRGSQLGAEIGYQIRFDTCVSRETRLIVATTGVLLRIMADDLALAGVGAVVLDEFHERTAEMDVVVGMLVRVQQTIRPDLRIAVMSATLETEPVGRLLGNAPIVAVPGQVFPVDIRYQKRRSLDDLDRQVHEAVSEAIVQTQGHVLVFLPGVGEIKRCTEALRELARRHDVRLLPLYGELPFEEQDRAIEPSLRRKLILSTNIAETSLTIEGVTAVVDSGWARQMQMDPHVGLPRLERVPISKASAHQRCGRAGRLQPGVCWRLWEAAAHHARPDYEAPEILRTDLSGPLLFLLHWGERELSAFPWVDRPSDEALELGLRQLQWLGAIDRERRLTEIGNRLVAMPAHPRLARLLLAGARRGILRESALAAALLSERDPFRPGRQTGPRDRRAIQSRCDVSDRVQAMEALAEGRPMPIDLPVQTGALKLVFRAAEQLARTVESGRAARPDDVESAIRQSLLEAYPDRLAQLRTGSRDRAILVGGRGVRIDPQSNVRPDRLFVCIDIDDGGGDAKARLISSVEREWLAPDLIRVSDETFFNPSRRQVETRRRAYWDDLLLEETAVANPDPNAVAAILADHATKQLVAVLPDSDSAAEKFRRKIQWLGQTLPELGLPRLDESELGRLLPLLAIGLRSFDELRRADWLGAYQAAVGFSRLPEIQRLAPDALMVPSGNQIGLAYEPGKIPVLAVRIQELFGLTETPRIAGSRVPIVLHLLGPNYRPQQVTNDLASFWSNGYPQVKKELRRRYPKHAWPDDPREAAPSRSGLQRDQR